jgi:hypothetical protein
LSGARDLDGRTDPPAPAQPIIGDWAMACMLGGTTRRNTNQ